MGNLSKYKNEDVNDEEYQEITLFYCAHCEYKRTDGSELKGHMEIDHAVDECAPLAENLGGARTFRPKAARSGSGCFWQLP